MSAYRDLATRFADESAQVLGVSMDDLATQKRFAESLALPFPLLADPDGRVATAYGVRSGDHPSRTTFVIARDGRITKVIDGLSAMCASGALDACSAGSHVD
jgi:peroxiredoxin Q/BCP